MKGVFFIIWIIDFVVDKCYWGARRQLCHIKFSEYVCPEGRYVIHVRARDYTFTNGKIVLTDRAQNKVMRTVDIADVNFVQKVEWAADHATLLIQDDPMVAPQRVTWNYYA